jgi:hypothetical protein
MYEEKDEGLLTTEVTDQQISIEEMPATVVPQEEALPQEEKPEQQEKVGEQKPKEKPSITKKKQKKRVATFLSNILKQAEKNGDEINKIRNSIQSLQKQTNAAGVGKESMKQLQSQIGQLQKQVTRIQKDIQRIRTASATKTRTRRRAFAFTIMPKTKKRKSVTSTKVR